MKKEYMKPATCVVMLQHSTQLMIGSVRGIDSNAGMNYGGGSSTEYARVKQSNHNVWDDDWSE